MLLDEVLCPKFLEHHAIMRLPVVLFKDLTSGGTSNQCRRRRRRECMKT